MVNYYFDFIILDSDDLITKIFRNEIYKRGNKMIKNKNNIIELLEENKSFSYFKNNAEIDVVLKESESINIRCYDDKCIVINFFDYEEGISILYKDRKYINMRMYSIVNYV